MAINISIKYSFYAWKMFNLDFHQPCIGTDSYLLSILNDQELDLTVECNDISSRGFMIDLLKEGTYFFQTV